MHQTRCTLIRVPPPLPRPSPPGSVAGRSLVLALTVHVGAVIWLAARPAPPRTGAVAAPGEIDLSDEALPRTDTTQIPAAVPAPIAHHGNLGSIERASPASHGGPAPPAPRPPAPPDWGPGDWGPGDRGPGIGAAVPQEVTDAGPPRATATLSLEAMGMGGPNRFLRGNANTDEVATDRERAEARVTHAMLQPLAERDGALGLGPEGPFLSAMQSSVYGSHLPLRGQATIDLEFESGGGLRTATVVSSDAAADDWAEVLAQARAQTTRREGSRGRGQRVRIAVSTDKLMPSGRHPGVAVDVLGVPLKEGEGPKSTKLSVLGRPKVVMLDAGVIALPMLVVPLAELNADPADLGAAPRRVVHTRVVSRQVL